MTFSAPSPALVALQRELAGRDYLDFAEVRLIRSVAGCELRHVSDASSRTDDLRSLAVSDLRELAQTTTSGAFRPVKTAPNLRRGWRCEVALDAALAEALEALYPGALIDWWAAAQPNPPVQDFREFTGRQSGMYRGIQELTDSEAAALIRAGCDAQFCLRQRRWTIPGLAPEAPATGKSVIPCLEPCPVMLEFARQGRRLLLAAPVAVSLAPEEVVSLIQALDLARHHPAPEVREGDLSQPDNPRRIRLLRDRLQGLLPKSSSVDPKE